MPGTINIKPGQSTGSKNKKLIFVITICFLNDFYSKKTNSFQIINRQFLYTNYISKQTIKSLYQIKFNVFNGTIYRVF